MTAETTLVRTRKSMIYHRSGCHYAHNGAPWRWAEDKTREQIQEVERRTGLKPCQFCDPLSVMPVAFRMEFLDEVDGGPPRHRRQRS